MQTPNHMAKGTGRRVLALSAGLSGHGRARTLVASAIAGLAVGVSGQVPVTVINGFNNQFWNASVANLVDQTEWRAESPATNFANGLRWTYLSTDPQIPVAVSDPAVPGISGAFQFPGAAATGIGSNWEAQAAAGVSGTFEVWFKPSDLVGTHVLVEIGAANKGVAIALEGNELVFAAAGNDGAGGNSYTYVHREPLMDTDWHQAAMVVSFTEFSITAYVDGVPVNTESIPPAASYRWSGANPAGLGTLGTDPLFPDSSIAAAPIPAADFTDYDGLLGIYRFYTVDLFASEIADNYAAMTDAAAATRRGDYNGDGVADDLDQLDVVTMAEGANTTPINAFDFPFPARGGGFNMHDPALNETYVGDFHWQRDSGFFNTEPTFRFPAISVLNPQNIVDPSYPTIRTAFVMDGVEGFRGPAVEPLDDNGNSAQVEFWIKPADLVGTHCLYEAGGDALGFSVVMVGDQLRASINTSADDAPGVLTTGWHKVEFVVRRINSAAENLGQGIELYVDGALVAQLGDLPGPDGLFDTADDINQFSPGTANGAFVGGNQSGFMNFWSSVNLPDGLTTGDLTPFNGLVGPFRLSQAQPLPSVINANYLRETTEQNTTNGRVDINKDGEANFLDTIEMLKQIDAGR